MRHKANINNTQKHRRLDPSLSDTTGQAWVTWGTKETSGVVVPTHLCLLTGCSAVSCRCNLLIPSWEINVLNQWGITHCSTVCIIRNMRNIVWEKNKWTHIRNNKSKILRLKVKKAVRQQWWCHNLPEGRSKASWSGRTHNSSLCVYISSSGGQKSLSSSFVLYTYPTDREPQRMDTHSGGPTDRQEKDRQMRD